jgi:mannitol/fructose-specific phosphotransferase system IIA component (Ntr-type)
MSYVDQDLSFDLIIPSLKVPHQKQVFMALAEETSKVVGIREKLMLSRLNKAAEGAIVQKGVCVMEMKSTALTQPFMVLARVPRGIEDAKGSDGLAADLFAVLVSPEHDAGKHLQLLARWSRLLHDNEFCAKLRAAADADDMRMALRTETRLRRQQAA